MSSFDQKGVKRAVVGLDFQEISIDDLARRSRSGDSSAFAELATRIRPQLLAVLYKRLHGRAADAEDVAQVTLTKAWANIRDYDVTRPFTAWIVTIAIRSSIDYQRQQRRHEEHVDEHTETLGASPRLARKSEGDRNVWAIARRVLSKTQYSALWLRYGEDRSVSEIAQTMGKTNVAVRVVLCRARARLQSHLVKGKVS